MLLRRLQDDLTERSEVNGTMTSGRPFVDENGLVHWLSTREILERIQVGSMRGLDHYNGSVGGNVFEFDPEGVAAIPTTTGGA